MTPLEAFWLATYVIALFGSVSFGYLMLRFGLPDIRAVPRHLKLGLAGLLGIAVFAAALALSVLFGQAAFLALLPFIAFIGSGVLLAKQVFAGPAEVTVAVPVVRLAPEALLAPVPARRPPRREAVPPAPPAPPAEVPPVEEAEKVKRLEEMLAKPPEERPPPPAPAAPPAPPVPLPVVPVPAAYVPEERRLRGRERYRRRPKDHLQRYEEQKPAMLERAAEELAAPATLEELAGLDTSGLGEVGSLDELSELGLESLGEMEVSLESLAGMAAAEKVPRQKGMGCPACNSFKGTIIYCPYCGKGFCSDCSGRVERKADLVFYQCPTCKKEVIVKAAG